MSMLITPKRDQFVSNNLFKGSAKKTEKAKGSFRIDAAGGPGAATVNKSSIRYSTGAQKSGNDRRSDIIRGDSSPIKSSSKKTGVAKNHSQMNFEYQPVSISKAGSKAKPGSTQSAKVEMKSASVTNFSLSMIANPNDLAGNHHSILEKSQHARSKDPPVQVNQHIYMSVKNE